MFPHRGFCLDYHWSTKDVVSELFGPWDLTFAVFLHLIFNYNDDYIIKIVQISPKNNKIKPMKYLLFKK